MLDFYYGFLLLIEACISTIVGVFIIRRAKSLKLNQILSLVMFTFTGFVLFEAIIYLFNITDNPTIMFFRILSLACSTSSAVLLAFSAWIVRSGEVVTEDIKIILAVISCIVLLLIFGLPTITVSTVDNPLLGVSYLEFHGSIIGTILLQIVPVILILITLFQYLSVRRSSKDPILRKKLLNLSIGLALILLGVLYYALFQLFLYPGHVAYFAGLIFIFWAFKPS